MAKRNILFKPLYWVLLFLATVHLLIGSVTLLFAFDEDISIVLSENHEVIFKEVNQTLTPGASWFVPVPENEFRVNLTFSHKLMMTISWDGVVTTENLTGMNRYFEEFKGVEVILYNPTQSSAVITGNIYEKKIPIKDTSLSHLQMCCAPVSIIALVLGSLLWLMAMAVKFKLVKVDHAVKLPARALVSPFFIAPVGLIAISYATLFLVIEPLMFSPAETGASFIGHLLKIVVWSVGASLMVYVYQKWFYLGGRLAVSVHDRRVVKRQRSEHELSSGILKKLQFLLYVPIITTLFWTGMGVGISLIYSAFMKGTRVSTHGVALFQGLWWLFFIAAPIMLAGSYLAHLFIYERRFPDHVIDKKLRKYLVGMKIILKVDTRLEERRKRKALKRQSALERRKEREEEKKEMAE